MVKKVGNNLAVSIDNVFAKKIESDKEVELL